MSAEPGNDLELLSRIRSGDRQAAAALVLRMRPLIRNCAKRFRTGCLQQDLMSEGIVAVLEAVPRFDAGRGVQFSTYAMFWVRKRLHDCFAAWERLEAERADLSFEPQRIPVADTERRQRTERIVSHLLDYLSDRDRLLVELIHGLNGHEPHTVTDAAIMLGISRKAASVAYNAAMGSMREAVQPKPLKPILARELVPSDRLCG